MNVILVPYLNFYPVYRRKNAIAAALGKTSVSSKDKKTSESFRKSLLDEFAAF